jgi:hypothetical protein
MAIILEAAYSKKLGLPGFSSHSYNVSVRSELNDISQVPEESARLYGMLQAAVDKEMQEPGFVPDEAYGIDNIHQPSRRQNSNGASSRPTNGSSNGNGHHTNGNGHTNGSHNGNGNGSRQNGSHQRREESGITDKQLSLIEDIVRQNNAKGAVDQLSVEMFGGGVRTLNRLQASNFIDVLFERYPRQVNGSNSRGNYRQPARS